MSFYITTIKMRLDSIFFKTTFTDFKATCGIWECIISWNFYALSYHRHISFLLTLQATIGIPASRDNHKGFNSSMPSSPSSSEILHEQSEAFRRRCVVSFSSFFFFDTCVCLSCFAVSQECNGISFSTIDSGFARACSSPIFSNEPTL